MGGTRLAGTVGVVLLLAAVLAAPQTDPAPAGKGIPATGTAQSAAFPSSAQIVSTQLITLPPVAIAPSAQPDANQADVFFRDRLNGFLADSGGPAIGSNDQGGVYSTAIGGISRTTDGGGSWHLVWSRQGASISQIGFTTGLTGWAAGWQYPVRDDGSNTGSPLWLQTSDGGASWSATTPAVPALGDWWDWGSLQFTFQNASLGLAVIDPDANAGPLQPLLLRTADGGRSWQRMDLHGWRPTGGIAFSGPRRAFATGYAWPLADGANSPAGIWTTYDGGLSWWRVMTVSQPFQLYAINFPDPLHGFAAGGNLEKYEQRPSRALLASVDGGRTWSLRYQSAASDISDQITRLHFVDALHGWAATGGCSEGANGPCSGTMMVTGDGGRSWRMASQNALDFAPLSQSEAWVIDGGRGQGVVVHTVDAGDHWSAVVQPWAFGISALSVSGSAMLAQTPVGSAISADGGRSWQSFEPPLLAGRPLLDYGDPLAIAIPPSVLMLQDPRTPTGLAISQDGGQHWTSMTLPGDANGFSGFEVALADPAHAFAIVGNQVCTKGPGPIPTNGKPPVIAQGMANLLTSADGGLTWTPVQSLPVYVNALSAASGLVAFTGSKGGCQRPGTNIVALSRDNGRHWVQQTLPANCDSISVASPSTIWLRCADDQSYLLVTQDGGRTWTKLVTASASMIFPATVVASGPSEAWAYGPPWSLWHTSDAGRTWVAEPLPATIEI